jgi:hypothetical protein
MPNVGLDPYDCDCGWLARAANDPGVPIGFEVQTNEYYVEVRGPGGLEGRMIIHFCPNCGGDAPVSKRAELFCPVSMEDQAQIHQFNSELGTKADVLAKWGKPDEEVRGGYGIPESNQEGARMILFDVLRYNKILPTAVVDVIVRHNDAVSISYMPKARAPHEG